MRPRLLDRYVAREFLRLFLLFALAAPVLFILGDLMDNLDKYMNRGLTVRQVAFSYLYQTPLFVLYSLPVSSLIASVFTVSTMTRHSEVAAAKAGGISFFRLFAALPLLGVLLTIGGLGLSELVPVTNRMRAEVLGEKQRMRPSRTDFVYRAGDGSVYSIRRLDVERSRIDALSVEREGNEPKVPSIHLAAREAVYDTTGRWLLRRGQLRVFAGAGHETAFRFDSLRTRRLTETPEELLAEPKDPEEMRYGELGRLIDHLERSGGRPLELMVERAQKIALPVATLVIILFAVPLSTSSRRGGSAHGVGVSLAITIVYLMLFRIAGAAGASGAIPPALAAWFPNLVFTLAAAVLVTRVRT